MIPNALKPSPHLRLTPEQIKADWLLGGLYTPAGYLYNLIRSLRKDGWWYRVTNVTQFCREWAINRRTFYAAKANLISRKLLEENILGGVDLRKATRAGFSLAQIGEFSFIIAGLGVTLGVTSDRLYSIAILVSAATTLTTPYLIAGSGPAAGPWENAGNGARRMRRSGRVLCFIDTKLLSPA